MPVLPADIDRVFRQEYGRTVAVLVRAFGDIDVAEEAVQDAFTEAVRRWRAAGMPPSPAGWIITTARNRAIDRLRREASRADRQALDLPNYDVLHAVRADLLRRLGRLDEAVQAYGRAIELSGNPAERAFLERRRDALVSRPGPGSGAD